RAGPALRAGRGGGACGSAAAAWAATRSLGVGDAAKLADCSPSAVELGGEQIHQQSVVPGAVGAALVAAHQADRTEADALVRADRLCVRRGRVDRDSVVAALLEELAGGEAERLAAQTPSLGGRRQCDVEP